MATLPNPDTLQRRLPNAQAPIASYEGGAVGRAQAQFGSEVGAMIDIERKRIDDSAVERAITELRQKSFDLRYGENGAMTQRGAQVVVTPEGGKPFVDKYKEQHNAMAQAVGGRLSDNQRAAFQSAVDQDSLMFQADITKHAMRESVAVDATNTEAHVNLNTEHGSFYYADPAMLVDLERDTEATLYRAGTRNGIPSEVTKLLISKSVSAMYEGAIAKAHSEGHPEIAAQIFEAHKDKITNTATGKAVATATAIKTGQTLGTDAAAASMTEANQTGDLQTAYVHIRKNLPEGASPEVEAHARQEAASWISARRDALTQQEAAPLLSVIRGESIAKVRTSQEYLALSPAGQAKVEKTAQAEQDHREGKSEKLTGEKIATYYDLRNDATKLTSMTNSEIALYGANKGLSPSLISNLMDTSQSYKADRSKVIEAKVDKEAMTTLYHVVTGHDPAENKLDFAQAQYDAENRIDAAQRATGRVLGRVEKDAIIREVFRPITFKGRFGTAWGTHETPAYQVKGEGTLAIDPADRAQIVRVLESKAAPGTTVTERQIQDAYRLYNNLPMGKP